MSTVEVHKTLQKLWSIKMHFCAYKWRQFVATLIIGTLTILALSLSLSSAGFTFYKRECGVHIYYIYGDNRDIVIVTEFFIQFLFGCTNRNFFRATM